MKVAENLHSLSNLKYRVPDGLSLFPRSRYTFDGYLIFRAKRCKMHRKFKKNSFAQLYKLQIDKNFTRFYTSELNVPAPT